MVGVGGVTGPVGLLGVGGELDEEVDVEVADRGDGSLDDEVVVVFLECSEEEEGGYGVDIHEHSKALRGRGGE